MNTQALPAERAKRRRKPFGTKLYDGEFLGDPYVKVYDRGALIGMNPVDPSIYQGGRVETVIGVSRLACLAGLLHGRLVFRVATELWNPPKRGE